MTSAPPRLETSIKSILAPILRKDGFAGSGRTYRRVRQDVIELLNVQGSRWGGSFAVNLAVQPLVLPDVLGNGPDPKKITESLCEFRRRMTESGTDQWWEHGNSQPEMDSAIKEAADVYVRVGRGLLDSLSGPDSMLSHVTPVQLEERGLAALNGFGSTPVRMALVLGKMRKAEGNHAAARAFAEFGLNRVSEQAAAIRRELEFLYTPV